MPYDQLQDAKLADQVRPFLKLLQAMPPAYSSSVAVDPESPRRILLLKLPADILLHRLKEKCFHIS